MQGSPDLLLWEDLGLVCSKSHRANEILQAILDRVQQGQLDQPSRQDSQHLNRLIVLADLLCDELRSWANEITPRTKANGNGTR